MKIRVDKDGIFIVVIKGGKVCPGDTVKIVSDNEMTTIWLINRRTSRVKFRVDSGRVVCDVGTAFETSLSSETSHRVRL